MIARGKLLASALVIGLMSLAGGQAANADVFQLGGTYTVTGSDFPTNFGPENVTLDETTKPINGGLLTLSEAITPISANSAFIQFNFATASGGPLVSDPTAEFQLIINNVPITGPAVLSDPFVFFSANGTPFNPLTPSGGFGVEANPVDPSLGSVLDFNGFTPVAVDGTFELNVFSNPYSFISTTGVDPTTANGISFGAEVTLDAVPEPASLAILGSGLLGLAAFRRRRSV